MTEQQLPADENQLPEAENLTNEPTNTLETEMVDENPPIKKTPKDYILERQARKRQEAEEKARALEAELEMLRNGNQTMETNSTGSNEIFEHTRDLERKMEVRDFLMDNPQFKPFQDKMLKWSKHDAYARIPVEQLAYAVAGKNLFGTGSNEVAQANAEAAASRVSGGAVQTNIPKQPVSYSTMSDAEFIAEMQKVKRGH